MIDPATNALAAAVRVGSEPVALGVGAGGVWVASAADGTVARVDPRRRAVARNLGTGRIPTAIATGADMVWVANAATGASTGTVSRIPVATGAASSTVVRPGTGIPGMTLDRMIAPRVALAAAGAPESSATAVPTHP
jgi:DNA-binding beta-propeller fold protein YncE